MEDVARAAGPTDPAESLERVAAAVKHARRAASCEPGRGEQASPETAGGSAQFLAALALLRELRAQIASWEPDLIDAARGRGASWAELAPALGVASRQAAERRYLRLRPASGAMQGTGDERVRAERDRRAGQRAVALWARDHAADLRQLAGQITALSNLSRAADGDLAQLRLALGGDDAAQLLAPLAGTHEHLEAEHPALAARLREVAAHTDTVRRGSHEQRRAGRSDL
ncbi:HSP18 transcriptional regulator [Actinocrinis puniceicyclus]|uniref:HSP18 transcriptional regulator n=1 Tax=Actinocrinis puniceicyclus TaxID=977794 RepID=A0A8J8B957_9ACTN|nr:HSP18 transcriptional regulator [Actinocrinis puniceicyclus]MBS2961477.1 HSP18 transcriptional regulator [Actinocrinis puniceicyclus]